MPKIIFLENEWLKLKIKYSPKFQPAVSLLL